MYLNLLCVQRVKNHVYIHSTHSALQLIYMYLINKQMIYICFFEVNTKYISSSELKTSEFS